MGEGVEQDDDAAYEWFQAAAEQGYPYAQLFAERMEDGQSVVPTVLLSASRLLHHMGDVFRDKVPTTSTSGGMHKNSGKRKLPWDTSRTTMRRNRL